MDKTPQVAPLDPLRRVLVPIEETTSEGIAVFRTSDRELYTRDAKGVIRNVSKAKRRAKTRLTK